MILTIDPRNDAPTANNISLSLDEDDEAGVVLEGQDVDSTPIEYIVITGPSSGLLLKDGVAFSGYPSSVGDIGRLTFRPEQDFDETDAFVYKTSDGALESEPATVAITVNPVNDAPIANPYPARLDEDTILSLVLTGSDVEGDVLSYSITNPPAHGTLVGDPPSVTYIPNADYYGPDKFFFIVNDGQLDAEQPAEITLDVSPINDAPVGESLTFQVEEDSEVQIDLTGTDLEEEPLSFIIDRLPANGTLYVGGVEIASTPHFLGDVSGLVYRPDPDFDELDAFTYRAFDGDLYSSPSAVTIDVLPLSDAPVAKESIQYTREDIPLSFELEGDDVDSANLSFTLIDHPVNGVAELLGRSLVYRPRANYFGSDSLSYVVSDGVLVSEIALVEIVVSEVNDAPSVVASEYAIGVDSSLGRDIVAKDVDDDVLSFSIVAQPLHGAVTISGDGFTYVPDEGYSGYDSFEVAAFDGTEFSLPAKILIYLSDSNLPPEIVSTPIERFGFYGNGVEAIELSDWHEHQFSWHTSGGHLDPQWLLSEGASKARQINNNFAGALLSDFEFFQNRIEIDFRIDANWDDDGVGFVWGYQNENDNYRLQWGRQSGGNIYLVGLEGGDRNAKSGYPWQYDTDYTF